MSFCSPIADNDTKPLLNESCLNNEIVNKIVTEYNSSPDIDSKIDETKPDDEKMKEIKQKLTDKKCQDEWCLSSASIPLSPRLRTEIKERFRPELPRDWINQPRKWLNTLDIEASMKQYSKAYPQFNFLSVSPIDFDTRVAVYRGSSKKECVDENLCKLNILDELDKKPQNIYIGAIFNLDKHTESGSHWTSMFSSILLGESYYYDSVANYFPEEVQTLMERISIQGEEAVQKGKLELTNLQHRFTFNSNENLTIDINNIINYLLDDNYFTLYRFGHAYEFQYGYKTVDDISKHKFTLSHELEGQILKYMLNKIDMSKYENYAYIPQLEKLTHITETNQMPLNDFVRTWIYTQTDIAINNFIDSLRLLKRSDTGDYMEIESITDIQPGGKITIELKTKSVIPKGTQFVDCSFKMFKNFIQHQFKNTECGMYSIHFIDNFLTNEKTFEQIVEHVITDDEMNEMRRTNYYRPPIPK
jgi:hypothetical protein